MPSVAFGPAAAFRREGEPAWEDEAPAEPSSPASAAATISWRLLVLRIKRPPSSLHRWANPVGSRCMHTDGTTINLSFRSLGGSSIRRQVGACPAAASNSGCHSADQLDSRL